MIFNSIKEICRGKFLGIYVANYTSESGQNKDYEIISRRPISDVSDLKTKNHMDG